MSEEEKKELLRLEKWIRSMGLLKEANLIDKLQKENTNKDKVIDLMAEHLFNIRKMPYRTNIFTKEELIQKYYEEVGEIE